MANISGHCYIVHCCFWICLLLSLRPGCSCLQTAETCETKGHLQPFGLSGTRKEIEIRSEFPAPFDFLVDYVQLLKPVKLPGVFTNSRAVREWSDDYLLKLHVPHDSIVHLETKKKENRDQETIEMHFHDFLKIYNQTEHYMVDDVPAYLRPDVMVPCSLQCPELMEEGLAFAMMWFSSGGTKSVVHTDSFDNINCLIRGEKTFVMIDPARDREKIKIKTDGAYSDIDVDSVDLTVYPELADVEFYHVHVRAGDCVYIPYQWIHQVRSFSSNVAVNFWWNHYSSVSFLEKNPDSACQSRCDPDLTLDKVKLHHEDPTLDDSNTVRDWVRNIVLNDPLTPSKIFEEMKMEFGVQDLSAVAEKLIIEIYEKIDLNRDGEFTKEEHAQIPKETWDEVQRDIAALSVMVEDGKDAERSEYAAYVEADRRDEL